MTFLRVARAIGLWRALLLAGDRQHAAWDRDPAASPQRWAARKAWVRSLTMQQRKRLFPGPLIYPPQMWFHSRVGEDWVDR